MASVLHVVSYFPPDRMGGVGEVVANVHRSLLADGHRSIVLTTGVTKGEPGVVRTASTPAGFSVACLRHVALARRADIVHVHHGEGLALVAAMRLLGVRTPVLLTLHVGLPALRRSLRPYTAEGRLLGKGGPRAVLHRVAVMRVREWLDRGALRLADQVNFISRSAAADVLPQPERASARVIYNGLPAADSPGAPNAVSSADGGASPEPVELLFVGANNVRKRVELLPFVLARVRLRQPTARLRVIGFGRDDNPELLRLARELGVLEAIVFEGRKRSEELPRFYRAARVLLVPSAYEGLPMVILEAFQNGLPCVATRVSGHPEVIEDGESGFLVELDRPDEMADAALKVISDPDRARDMGERGRDRVERRFLLGRQLSEYLALYEEMRVDLGRISVATVPGAGA
ncbi:MAG: glycosyltransferase family 4 protein [Gemmatimonadaceae bacterium]